MEAGSLTKLEMEANSSRKIVQCRIICIGGWPSDFVAGENYRPTQNTPLGYHGHNNHRDMAQCKSVEKRHAVIGSIGKTTAKKEVELDSRTTRQSDNSTVGLLDGPSVQP